MGNASYRLTPLGLNYAQERTTCGVDVYCSNCKLFSQDEVDRWEARMANPGHFGGGAQMFAGGFGLAMLQNK